VKDPSIFSQRRIGALEGRRSDISKEAGSFKQRKIHTVPHVLTRFEKWTEANSNVAGRPRLRQGFAEESTVFAADLFTQAPRRFASPRRKKQQSCIYKMQTEEKWGNEKLHKVSRPERCQDAGRSKQRNMDGKLYELVKTGPSLCAAR
jgi:hypothetical protein